MVKRIACCVAVFSLLMLWPTALAAAEEKEGQIIALLEEYHVFPDRAKEFEGCMKEAMEAAATYGFPHRWDLYALDDLRYLGLVWVDGMAGIDSMQAAWAEVEAKWGEEKSADWAKRLNATMSHWDSSVWIPRPDLSYTPENQADEFSYIVWGVLPIKLGHQQVVEKLFKEYVEVFAEHEIPHAWRTAEGSVGVENPTLAFVEWAASPGSYWTRHDEAVKNEELSAKTDALWGKILPHIRGFDWVAGRYLEELSYRPEKKETAQQE